MRQGDMARTHRAHTQLGPRRRPACPCHALTSALLPLPPTRLACPNQPPTRPVMHHAPWLALQVRGRCWGWQVQCEHAWAHVHGAMGACMVPAAAAAGDGGCRTTPGGAPPQREPDTAWAAHLTVRSADGTTVYCQVGLPALRPLSPSTAKSLHGVVHICADQATVQPYVERDPAAHPHATRPTDKPHAHCPAGGMRRFSGSRHPA